MKKRLTIRIIFCLILFLWTRLLSQSASPQIEIRLLAPYLSHHFGSTIGKIICTMDFIDPDGDILWGESFENSAQIVYQIDKPNVGKIQWGSDRSSTNLTGLTSGKVYTSIQTQAIYDTLILTISLIDSAGNESNVITESITFLNWESGIDVSADSLAFESTEISDSTKQKIIISNTSPSRDLVVHAFTNSTVFVTDQIFTIAPLDSQQLIIAFTPNESKEYSDALTICSNTFWPVKKIKLIGEGIVTAIENRFEHPKQFSLSQNYPNPFNSTTTIRFEVKSSKRVVLSIYDVLGQKVQTLVDEKYPAGCHEVIFDANQLVSGIYFYEMKIGDSCEVKKMLFLK